MSGPKVDKGVWGGVETFDALLSEIGRRRDEFEAQRYISEDIVKRFQDIGVYRAFVPVEYGGLEVSPTEFLCMVEAISVVDGAAGWVASFGICESYLAGLPLDSLRQTWSDPDAIFAGAMFPLQPAEVIGERYRISGRWQWASGCMSADRIGVGIIPDQPGSQPLMAVLPAECVHIDMSSWQTTGMRGTGSFDITVDRVDIDPQWCFVRGGELTPDGPFVRYPTITIAAQALAVTSLGIARCALDLVRDAAILGKAGSVTGAPNIGDRSYVKTAIATAEARLRAARLFFYDSIDAAWKALDAGEHLNLETANMMRLSCTHLTHECAAVTDIAYAVSGMAATATDNQLSRCWRDAHMPTQHAFMNASTYEQAGTVLLGRDAPPGFLGPSLPLAASHPKEAE